MASALLGALHFAARKHAGQKRKDGVTPYINHPIAVAELLARIGKVGDVAVLQAALLHDTVEDTDTSPEELEGVFGREVRAMVMEVTDDMSVPKKERRERQLAEAPNLSPGAKHVRIADKICNFWDITLHQPLGWPMHVKRGYLEWGEKVVDACRGINSALEAHFDQVLKERRRELGL
ncbi:HD domain-containing protein [Verrucomicrobiota bacterium sgz303538]